MMKRLHDYLDSDEIIIETIDGQVFRGTPICVNYPDDTGSDKDEIVIENDGMISFTEDEIDNIKIVDD